MFFIRIRVTVCYFQELEMEAIQWSSGKQLFQLQTCKNVTGRSSSRRHRLRPAARRQWRHKHVEKPQKILAFSGFLCIFARSNQTYYKQDITGCGNSKNLSFQNINRILMCRAEHRVAADLMLSVTGGRVQPAVIFRDGGSVEDEPDSA